MGIETISNAGLMVVSTYLFEFLDVSLALLGHHPELDLERHLHILLFLLYQHIIYNKRC